MTVVGMAAVPQFLARAAMAADAAQAHRRLVVIFQRGAADGLNIVVPHGEPAYYTMRPTIAIPEARCDRSGRLLRAASAMSALKPCGMLSIWRLCMPPGRPIRRARTSMRRTSWKRHAGA